MTHSSQKSKWPTLGLLAFTMALGVGSQNAAAVEAPGVTLLATDPSALTGSSTGAFTLVRHGDTNVPLTVNLTLGGTASNGVDYTAIDSVQTLDPGVLAVDLVVQALVNPANRGNKTVTFTVQTNSVQVYGNPSATVKIVDDLYDVPPPSVTVTNPVEGSVYTVSEAITISADATDSQLTVARVSFYANDNFLGSVTNAPYTFVWTNAHAGSFAIFARAADQFGKSAVSTPVDITVSDAPVATLSGYTIVGTGQIDPLSITFADPNENVSSVSYYVNGKLVGTVTTAPFSFNWQTTTAGTFNVQAIATDANTGKKGKSNVMSVDVTSNLGS